MLSYGFPTVTVAMVYVLVVAIPLKSRCAWAVTLRTSGGMRYGSQHLE